ncbi:MAG: sulfatase [Planctomycetota bacterium]
MKRSLILLVIAAVLSGVDCLAEPTNLLIIQTDEHNFRTLGCYRATLPVDQALIWGEDGVVETPAIDSIAQRGVICTSFYATSPVCTPSRASFFSGLYPHRTGSPQNDLPLNSDVVTFAEVLRRSGYATGYAGKWHLDGNGKPQWAPERQFGFADNRYMFNRGHWKRFEITDSGPRIAARNRKGEPSYDLGDADKDSFSTDWLTDRAINFIREHAEEDFCYHLSLPDPHGPNTVREPYDEMFADRVIRAPLTFSMVKDNPKWAAVTGKNATKKFNSAIMAKYFGMVRCIDDNVSRLLQVLDELGLTEKTIVVFTSDHGDLCFEHGRLNKGNPYEASAKIPMIVSAPGKIPPGSRVDAALGTVDFAPTILALLGQQAPKATQGRDCSSLLQGKTDGWRDVTFLRNGGIKPAWIAAVTDRRKLVLSVSDRAWLFDHQTDPDELKNQFDDPSNADIVKQLANSLVQYGEQNDDPFVTQGPLRKQLDEILK